MKFLNYKHFGNKPSADKLVPIFRHSPYRDHFNIFGPYFAKLVPILPKWYFECKIYAS